MSVLNSKNKKAYLAGLDGMQIANMLENGNAKERQTVLDMVANRLGSELAEQVAKREVQVVTRTLLSTFVIHNGTTQETEIKIFAKAGALLDEKAAYCNVEKGKVKNDCITHSVRVRYGTKAEASSAIYLFTPEAMPTSLLSSEIRLKVEGNTLQDLQMLECLPVYEGSTLYGFNHDLIHPKFIKSLNPIADVTDKIQLLQVGLIVTEFVKNILQ
jgi:hypothetical protein